MKFEGFQITYEDDDDSFLCGPNYWEVDINAHMLSVGKKWLLVALAESAWHFWRWRLWRREK